MSSCPFPTTITITPRALPLYTKEYLSPIVTSYELFFYMYFFHNIIFFAKSAGAVEYTDCISAERYELSPPNESTGYDTKQFDGEAPVLLELWGMRSTPSLSSLPGPTWPRVVAPDRVLCMGQTELKCVLTQN